MAEDRRIARAYERAQASFQTLRSTSNPFRQQEAWEEFLVAWRWGLELVRGYADQRNNLAVREKFHKIRLESAVLNYMWEARNAEYHDPRGSAEAVGERYALHATDPSKPTYIDDLYISGDDHRRDFEAAKTRNATLVIEGRVDLQDVTDQRGRTIAPPKSKDLVECAAEGLRYALDFRSALL